jgi:hypothetical protein
MLIDFIFLVATYYLGGAWLCRLMLHRHFYKVATAPDSRLRTRIILFCASYWIFFCLAAIHPVSKLLTLSIFGIGYFLRFSTLTRTDAVTIAAAVAYRIRKQSFNRTNVSIDDFKEEFDVFLAERDANIRDLSLPHEVRYKNLNEHIHAFLFSRGIMPTNVESPVSAIDALIAECTPRLAPPYGQVTSSSTE